MSCHVYLPSDTKLADVARAIGLLCHCEKRRTHMKTSWAVHVHGVKWVCTPSRPEMPTMSIEHSPLLPGRTFAFFQYETTTGERRVTLGGSPKWIAIGKRLVQFFGGRLYTDEEQDVAAYTCPKPRPTSYIEDGKEWQDFEQGLWDLPPLTQDEIDACAASPSEPEGAPPCTTANIKTSP